MSNIFDRNSNHAKNFGTKMQPEPIHTGRYIAYCHFLGTDRQLTFVRALCCKLNNCFISNYRVFWNEILQAANV